MNLVRDFLMDRLRPGWRERAQAQDPIWSLIERLAVLTVAGPTWYFGNRAALALHFKMHPEDRLPFSDTKAQLPATAFIGSLLTGLLLLCLFGILLNCFESAVPWMRRRAETGSERVPELTITAANKELAKASIVLAIVAVPLDVYALVTSWQVH